MLPPLLSSLVARVSWAPRHGLVLALALVPAVAAALLIGILLYVAPPGHPPAPAGPPAGAGAALPPPAGLLVEVSGAVVHPGIYRVAKGDRAAAAIAAAGGFAPDADPGRLPNVAARLQDGQQIVVPALSATARPSSSARIAPVSLNTATAQQLASVPGFTPELAAEVITYRTEFGGFASTRELVDVLEMSETDYALAKRYVTI